MALQTDVETADPLDGGFARAVLAGLGNARKNIPCQFLYDARGSELFEDITQLEEYYPTRTEIGLLEAHGDEIAAIAGQGSAVVEFGSGSSRKTQILLGHLDEPAGYVPIDIDNEALSDATARLAKHFPDLPLHPLHGDFNMEIELPEAIATAPKLGFFPGSTIGNMNIGDAIDFLSAAGRLLGKNSAFLVGADLRKDLDILLPAYDDKKGVTAAFILNLIHRINGELGGDLDVAQFAHHAIYNERLGRVEIYIRSLRAQQIEILGERFSLAGDELIHIENSHKYTVPQFQAMALDGGWMPAHVWTDEQDYFSLHYLRRNGE